MDLEEFKDMNVESVTQSLSTKRIELNRSTRSKKEKKIKAPSPTPERAQQKSNPVGKSAKTGGKSGEKTGGKSAEKHPSNAQQQQSKSGFSKKQT